MKQEREKEKTSYFKIILVFILISANLLLSSCIKKPKKDTDFKNYLNIDASCYYPQPLVFPDISKNKGKIQDYWSWEYDHIVAYAYEIVLKIKYEESDFLEEIDRLSSLKCGKGDNAKPIMKDKDCILFEYYTYVAIYKEKCDDLEYASIDFKNNEIIYVRIESLSFEELTLDINYLPKAYTTGTFLDYHYDMYSYCTDKWFNEE